ncbi:MAG TPA: 6-carboxytetrahydropterin synthase [Fodinibius sp.]|nr:6-carboxytetrahydropterin synthase [Fodinibius sp.]
MVFVTRKAHFNAAHRLHNPEKSDQWNKDTFGKCNHVNWHGHNYIINVTVAGKTSDSTGYVIDLTTLKSIISKRIVEKCDHKNLNMDVPFLEGVMPTTENLVKAFFDELEQPIRRAAGGSGFLYSVEVKETERNSAEYCPYRLGKPIPKLD